MYAAADRGERLLPLPPLAPPVTDKTNSNRVRQRRRSRWAVWRAAVGIASGLGWAYSARYRRPFRHQAPLALSEMSTQHRESWHSVLIEARRLCEARRNPPETTGGAALSKLLKSPVDEYIPLKAKSTYVDPVADLIAEPSCTLQTVSLLDVLPPELATHYSSECSVLSEGGSDEAEIIALQVLAKRPDGDRRQYVKYLNRTDIQPMWTFCKDGEEKSSCSFKTVMKKNGIQQRKILPTLEANYRWGPPPRDRDLGLWVGRCFFGFPHSRR